MNDGPFRPKETQPQRIARGDLRDMIHAECRECQHRWWAPVIGRCPKCRAEGAAEIERLQIGAPRV